MAKDPYFAPIDFVRDGVPMTDFVKVDPNAKGARYTPDEQYHPTAIIGACTVCSTAGSLMFPSGFDYKTGDSLMDGKVVKVRCHTCRMETEFRPLTPKELNENQFSVLRRHYEIYKKMVVDGQEIPFETRAFVEAYDKKLKEISEEAINPKKTSKIITPIDILRQQKQADS